MSTGPKTQEEAVYSAPQSHHDWLLDAQRKLYERSWERPGYAFNELWGLVTDLQNLSVALNRVSHNRGRNTAGVDGQTVRSILSREGAQPFLQRLRQELRSRTFQPTEVRRLLIPKPGKPGKLRPLGIPTVKDRVVQAAIKAILEPIFEADFYPVSYGFRPQKGAHAALEHLRIALRPRAVHKGKEIEHRLTFGWAIEGDIKGCFDHIDHHALMNRLRRRCGDNKLNRLVLKFLKAGVMSEGALLRTEEGVPQGGILSPLLANIALSAIEERYERHTWPKQTPTLELDPERIRKRAENNRMTDRNRKQLPVFFPIRYADDFIILVSAPPGPDQNEVARRSAEQEKAALAEYLKDTLGLELSEEKTLVTPVTGRMRFLGYNVGVRWHRLRRKPVSTTRIPKEKSHRLKERIKGITRAVRHNEPLKTLLTTLNPVLRGWAYFFRHAWGAKRVFNSLDNHVWWTIGRWLQKKFPRTSLKRLLDRFGARTPGRRSRLWRDGEIKPFRLSDVKVEWYPLWQQRPPAFASKIYGEPGAYRKAHAGFGNGA